MKSDQLRKLKKELVAAKLHWAMLAFLLGVCIRVTFLLYNLSWNLAAEWTSLTKASLVAAELLSGNAPSIDFPQQESMDLFRATDRGTTLAHLVLIQLFGSSSLLKLRILNLILDSLMIFICFRIGKILKDARLACASAFAYAVFPPAVFICINPFWYTWLSAGALLCTWVVLELNTFRVSRRTALKSGLCFLFLLGAASLTTQFRSTFVFYLIFLATWLPLVTLVRAAKFTLPRETLKAAFLIFFAGVLTIFSGSAMNKLLYGGSEPMRSDFGHVLWVGFGEFENPMNITANDSSVGAYYVKQTGKTSEDLQFSGQGWKDYNSWLFREGLKFIADHPLLYISMVGRRCLKFVFPNFRISRISDLESFNLYEEKVLGTRAARLAIVKTDRIKTLEGLGELWKIDKSYFFEGALRIVMLFVLPLLLAFGFWSLGVRSTALLGASFFFYNLATLGPIRGPDMNLFSAWTAVVPILAAGALKILDQVAGRLRRARKNVAIAQAK